MKRRTLVSVIAAAAWPLGVRAQELAKPRRLAFVHSAIPADELTETAGPFWVRRFWEALRGLGYVEGRNLIVERFSAEGNPDRFAAVAQAVVGRKPDVIVTNLNGLVQAFRAATTTIPIVAIVGDPIRSGLVQSLARPGGNLTGVSSDVGVDVFAKAMQTLTEAVPSVTKVAYLASASQMGEMLEQVLRDAAPRLGVTLSVINPSDASEPTFRRAFHDMARQQLEAILVSPEGNFLAHRGLLIELAKEYRLPAMYPYREYAELGGLMAYSPDLGELAERLADDVRLILSGTSPSAIPIYQTTKIELVINLKTAKALGLSIPTSLLARADDVIE
jgi:putative ABC transport system substrate-binding protein